MISLNITRKNSGPDFFLPLPFPLQLFLQVPADGFAFAVGIGRQVDLVHLLRRVLQLLDQLLLALDHFVLGLEAILHIDRQILLRKILDMPQRRFDDDSSCRDTC